MADSDIEGLVAKIRQIAYDLHVYLGTGLLEKVYENGLVHRLQKAGFRVEAQKPLRVYDSDGFCLGEYFADLVVDDQIIVELKSVRNIANELYAQILNYLKITGAPAGLLINFGSYKFEVRTVIPRSNSPSTSSPLLHGQNNPPSTSSPLLACNFLMASLICFRCWEFWSLGGLEDLYKLLQISESPNLPVAKAIIKVIFIYIPARSAGGGLHGRRAGGAQVRRQGVLKCSHIKIMALFSRDPREHWLKPRFSKNEVASSGCNINSTLRQRQNGKLRAKLPLDGRQKKNTKL